jgi:pyruvate-formate lyase-activating enzyme
MNNEPKLLTAYEAYAITKKSENIIRNASTILDNVRVLADDGRYFSIRKTIINNEKDREFVEETIAFIKRLGYHVTMLNQEGITTSYKISWENANEQ